MTHSFHELGMIEIFLLLGPLSYRRLCFGMLAVDFPVFAMKWLRYYETVTKLKNAMT